MIPRNKAVRQSDRTEGACCPGAAGKCKNLAYVYSVEGATGYVSACPLHADLVFQDALDEGLLTIETRGKP